jgi:hypothetical protein
VEKLPSEDPDEQRGERSETSSDDLAQSDPSPELAEEQREWLMCGL